MKKLLTLIAALLLVTVCGSRVLAEGETSYSSENDYIILGNDYYLSDEDLSRLNDKAALIAERYGVDFFLVEDDAIPDSNLADFAENYLSRHGSASSGMILCINERYYYIACRGPKTRQLMTWEEMFWKDFADAGDHYSGIDAYLNRGEYVLQERRPSVVDMYGLLTESEYNILTRKIDSIRRKQGMDIVVITNYSLNGLTATEFIDDFIDYNNYLDDNVAILVSMGERDWATSTEGLGMTYFTDYGLDLLEKDFASRLSEGRYFEAFDGFADTCDDYITKGKNGDIVDYHATFGPWNVVFAAIIGLIVAGITTGIMKGKMKSVRRQTMAHNYIVDGSFRLTGRSDYFVNSHISRTRRPQQTRSSSSGSSGHYSSSGSFHGGHSGKF